MLCAIILGPVEKQQNGSISVTVHKILFEIAHRSSSNGHLQARRTHDMGTLPGCHPRAHELSRSNCSDRSYHVISFANSDCVSDGASNGSNDCNRNVHSRQSCTEITKVMATATVSVNIRIKVTVQGCSFGHERCCGQSMFLLIGATCFPVTTHVSKWFLEQLY